MHNKGDLSGPPQPKQNGQCLYQHGVGVRLRWSNHLAQRTSCAGMTAFLVLLAQTRGGFPQWGAREKLPSTPSTRTSFPKRRDARATVALTRAQQICFIMGPLDMRGLVGAATIIGCLKYGASFNGLDAGRPCIPHPSQG